MAIRKKFIFKIVSLLVLAAFTADTVSWAMPGRCLRALAAFERLPIDRQTEPSSVQFTKNLGAIIQRESPGYRVVERGDEVVVICFGQPELSDAQEKALENYKRDLNQAQRIAGRLGRTLSERHEAINEYLGDRAGLKELIRNVTGCRREEAVASAADHLQAHFNKFKENWKRSEAAALALDIIRRASPDINSDELIDKLIKSSPDLDERSAYRLKAYLNPIRYKRLVKTLSRDNKDEWTEVVFDALYGEWYVEGLIGAVQLTYLGRTFPVHTQDELVPEGDIIQPIGWSSGLEREVEDMVASGKEVTLLLCTMHDADFTRLVFAQKDLKEARGSLMIADVSDVNSQATAFSVTPEFASREGLLLSAAFITDAMEEAHSRLLEANKSRARLEREMELDDGEDLMEEELRGYAEHLAYRLLSRFGEEEAPTTEDIRAALKKVMDQEAATRRMGSGYGLRLFDRIWDSLNDTGAIAGVRESVRNRVGDPDKAASEIAESMMKVVPPMPRRKSRVVGKLAAALGAGGIAACFAMAVLGNAGQTMAQDTGSGPSGGAESLELLLKGQTAQQAGHMQGTVVGIEQFDPWRGKFITDRPAPTYPQGWTGLVARAQHLEQNLLKLQAENRILWVPYATNYLKGSKELAARGHIPQMAYERDKVEVERSNNVALAQRALLMKLHDAHETFSKEASNCSKMKIGDMPERIDAWRNFTAALYNLFDNEIEFLERAALYNDDLLSFARFAHAKGALTDGQLEGYRQLHMRPSVQCQQMIRLKQIYQDTAALGAPLAIPRILPVYPTSPGQDHFSPSYATSPLLVPSAVAERYTDRSPTGIWRAMPPVPNMEPRLAPQQRQEAFSRIKRNLIEMLILDIEPIAAQIGLEEQFYEWARLVHSKGYMSEPEWLWENHVLRNNPVLADRIKLISRQIEQVNNLGEPGALNPEIVQQLNSNFERMMLRSLDVQANFQSQIEYPDYLQAPQESAWFDARMAASGEMSAAAQVSRARLYEEMGMPLPLPQTTQGPRGGVSPQAFVASAPEVLHQMPSRSEFLSMFGGVSQAQRLFFESRLMEKKAKSFRRKASSEYEVFIEKKFRKRGEPDINIRLAELDGYLATAEEKEAELWELEAKLVSCREGTPAHEQVVRDINKTIMEMLEARLKWAEKNYEVCFNIEHLYTHSKFATDLGSQFEKTRVKKWDNIRDQLKEQISFYHVLLRMGEERGFVMPLTSPDYTAPSPVTIQELQRWVVKSPQKAEFAGYVIELDETGRERLTGTMLPGLMGLGQQRYIDSFGRSCENAAWVKTPGGVYVPRLGLARVTYETLDGSFPRTFRYGIAYREIENPVFNRDMGAGLAYVSGVQGLYTLGGPALLLGNVPKQPSLYLFARPLYTFTPQTFTTPDGRQVTQNLPDLSRVAVYWTPDPYRNVPVIGGATDGRPIVAKGIPIKPGQVLRIPVEAGCVMVKMKEADWTRTRPPTIVFEKIVAPAEEKKAPQSGSTDRLLEDLKRGLKEAVPYVAVEGLDNLYLERPETIRQLGREITGALSSIDGRVMGLASSQNDHYLADMAASNEELARQVLLEDKVPDWVREKTPVRLKIGADSGSIVINIIAPRVSRKIGILKKDDGTIDLNNAGQKIRDTFYSFAAKEEAVACRRAFPDLNVNLYGVDDREMRYRLMRGIRIGLEGVRKVDGGILKGIALAPQQRIDVVQTSPDGSVAITIAGVTVSRGGLVKVPIHIRASTPREFEVRAWKEIMSAYIKTYLLPQQEQDSWKSLCFQDDQMPEEQFTRALRLHLGLPVPLGGEKRDKFDAQLAYVKSLLREGPAGYEQRKKMVETRMAANVAKTLPTSTLIGTTATLLFYRLYRMSIGDVLDKRRRVREARARLKAFKGYKFKYLKGSIPPETRGLQAALDDESTGINLSVLRYKLVSSRPVAAYMTPSSIISPVRFTSTELDSFGCALILRNALLEEGFSREDSRIEEIQTPSGIDFTVGVRIGREWEHLTLSPVEPEVVSRMQLSDNEVDAISSSRRSDGIALSSAQPISRKRAFQQVLGYEVKPSSIISKDMGISVKREDNYQDTIQDGDTVTIRINLNLSKVDGWKRRIKLSFSGTIGQIRQIQELLAHGTGQSDTEGLSVIEGLISAPEEIGTEDISKGDEALLGRAAEEAKKTILKAVLKIDIAPIADIGPADIPDMATPVERDVKLIPVMEGMI